MAKEYPFSVPESTLDSINHRSTPLHERYGCGWKPDDYLPFDLSCLENWGMQLRAEMNLFEQACESTALTVKSTKLKSR